MSIKAKEADEEKAAMAEFGSADSGASLGDILGAALKKAKKAKTADEAEEEKPAKKTKIELKLEFGLKGWLIQPNEALMNAICGS